LHPYSYGNAVGVGLADFVHDRLVKAMDTRTTWVNVITALTTANARVPMHFPSDQEAFEAAFQTIGRENWREARVLWIKNTLSCEMLMASEAYLEAARARADLRLESEPAQPEFDARGDLLPLF
jgi:hypothetical protein